MGWFYAEHNASIVGQGDFVWLHASHNTQHGRQCCNHHMCRRQHGARCGESTKVSGVVMCDGSMLCVTEVLYRISPSAQVTLVFFLSL
eukprot:m.211633 g.211633  ORF g.211633 m.211633 type:complete len:88 (-) comp15066_c0_seq4:682-945(-)